METRVFFLNRLKIVSKQIIEMNKILIDTNIISDWLKGKIDVNINKFQNDIIYVPAMSLVELFRYEDLLEKLINLSQKVDIRIAKPSNMLLSDEKQYILNKQEIRIEIINLHEEALKDPQVLREYFKSKTFKCLVESLEKDENIGKKNISNTVLTNDYQNMIKFAESYLFTQVSINDPDFMKYIIERNRTNELFFIRSLVLQGYFIYSKYISKQIAVIDSDIFDGLIVATIPYVDVFYTEKQNCGIIKELKTKLDFLSAVEIYNYGDFKRFTI